MTCTGSAILPVNIFGSQAFCLINQCLASDPQPPKTFGEGHGSTSQYDVYRPRFGQIGGIGRKRKKRQQDWFYDKDSNENPENEESFDEPVKEDVIDGGDDMVINLEEQKKTNNNNPRNEEWFDENVVDDGDGMGINLDEQKENNYNDSEDVNNEQEQEPNFSFEEDINEENENMPF